jgi:hypothetical protein
MSSYHYTRIIHDDFIYNEWLASRSSILNLAKELRYSLDSKLGSP